MRELLQQALDALEDAIGLHVNWDDAHAETITALREALAAPQPEPVAWYRPSPDGDDSIFRDHRTVGACTGNKWEGFVPLYAAPPAAPAVPLTDKQINNIADALLDNGGCTVLTLARAIEKAHGIGGGND